MPAKYLGSDVNRLVTELQEPGLKEATVPVVATIGGRYSDPNVQTDLKQAVASLTSRLVEAQKQKLVASGKEKAKDLIGNLLKGSADSTRNSAPDSAKTGLGSVLKDVVGSGRQDTTKAATGEKTTAGEQVGQSARKILGGLLGKKKDTAGTAKDTLQ